MMGQGMEVDGSLVGAVVAAMAAFATTGVAFGKNTAQIKRLRDQVDELDDDLSETKMDTTDRMARIETKLAQIDNIDNKLDLLVARLNSVGQ